MVVENKKEEIAEVDLKDWWEAIKVGYKNADNKNCHIDLKELTSRQYKVFMKDLEKEGLYGMYKKTKLGAMKGRVAVTEKPLKETLRYGAQQGSCILQEKNPELHKKSRKIYR